MKTTIVYIKKLWWCFYEEKQVLRSKNRFIFYGFWFRYAHILDVPKNRNCGGSFRSDCYSRHHCGKIEGGAFMKVVMLETPKALKGLLRLIFGIKKSEDIT